MTIQHEHEFEAVPGLPEALPKGEHILWQGAPEWASLARRAFHARTLAAYFAIILAVRAVTMLSGEELQTAGAKPLVVSAVLAGLAVLAVAIVCLIAFLASRTTLYTITNRRVVMRVGVVLCITFNLPFSVIAAVGLRRYANGTGDIPLTLKSPNKIAFFHLWPHARPWHLSEPAPMLRSVPDAAHVGEVLTQAIAAALAPSARPTLVSSTDTPVSADARGRTAPARPLVAVNS